MIPFCSVNGIASQDRKMDLELAISGSIFGEIDGTMTTMMIMTTTTTTNYDIFT